MARKSGVIVPWPDPSLIAFDRRRGSLEFLKESANYKDELRRDPEAADSQEERAAGPKDTSVEKALERTYDYRRVSSTCTSASRRNSFRPSSANHLASSACCGAAVSGG